MSGTSSASAPSTSGKKSSKSSGAKKGTQGEHPTYAAMIQESLAAIKGKGASRQALLKYVMNKYNVGTDEKGVNTHLKLALKNGVKNGLLVQSTGTGASGTFKLGKKDSATTKKAKPATKASTAKTSKAAAVKKPKSTAAKASTAKKTAKPKKVSLGTSAAKRKKPSLVKKSAAKVVGKSKVAKKAPSTKAKATKAKVTKPKAAARKAKK